MEGKDEDTSIVYGSGILDLDKISEDNHFLKGFGNFYQGRKRSFYVQHESQRITIDRTF